MADYLLREIEILKCKVYSLERRVENLVANRDALLDIAKQEDLRGVVSTSQIREILRRE